MKKYIIASIMVFWPLKCYSAEWVAVGEQPELLNTGQIEFQLWEYLKAKSKAEFKPKETYRFQYKSIGESVILINALCLQSPKGEAGLGAYPGPTKEKLKKELYQVHDGGSCFFNIKYNTERSGFHSLYVNGGA